MLKEEKAADKGQECEKLTEHTSGGAIKPRQQHTETHMRTLESVALSSTPRGTRQDNTGTACRLRRNEKKTRAEM